MSLSCECRVLSRRGLCAGPITRTEKSYQVWCVWVWSWSLDNEKALGHCGLLRQQGEYMIWNSHVVEDKYCVRLQPCSLVDGHHRFGKLYCLFLQEISRVIRKMDVSTQVCQSESWMRKWKMVFRCPSRFAFRFCIYNCIWQNAEILKTKSAYSLYMSFPSYTNHTKYARLRRKLTGRSIYIWYIYIINIIAQNIFVAPLIIAIEWQVVKLHLMSDTCLVT